MASLSRAVPRRSGEFVCLTCRTRLRPFRHPQFLSTCSFNTTSSPHRNHTTLPTPLPLRKHPQTHRSYSTTTFASPPSTSGTTPLSHRRLLALSGPDAAKFLQGLVTNNIDPTWDSSLYAAFLDARGRVLWDVFVWVWPGLVAQKGGWACYIEVDEREVKALGTHLKRHKLRSKVVIEEVGEGDVGVWAAWGNEHETWADGAVVARLDDPRAPGMRRYLIRAGNSVKDVEVVDQGAYRLQRYRCGIPEGPLEIPRETALPMECNLDLNHAIDFKKGCYVGQELTIRTKHTGVVRKRILPVSFHHPPSAFTSTVTLPAPGTDIKVLDENGEIKKGRAVGKFVAGVGNVGLALCRLENMTSMKVSAEGGSWRPGMEFGIEGEGAGEGGVVRVMPVLFDWFVVRERELWDRERRRI